MNDWRGLREEILEIFHEAQNKGVRSRRPFLWVGEGVRSDGRTARLLSAKKTSELATSHAQSLRTKTKPIRVHPLLVRIRYQERILFPINIRAEQEAFQMAINGDPWEDIARFLGKSVCAAQTIYYRLSAVTGLRRPRVFRPRSL